MSAIVNLPKNMGLMDRIIRGALGGALLTCNTMMGKNPLSKLVGGAFVFYSVTGWDPLLSLFNTNTLPGNPKNLMHKLKAT